MLLSVPLTDHELKVINLVRIFLTVLHELQANDALSFVEDKLFLRLPEITHS